MADFLMRLAARTLGVAPAAQPIIAPMFAPGPTIGGEYPIEMVQEIEVSDDPGQQSIVPGREPHPTFSRPNSSRQYPVVEPEGVPNVSTLPLQVLQENAQVVANLQHHHTPDISSTSHSRSTPAQATPNISSASQHLSAQTQNVHDISSMPDRHSVPAQTIHRQERITVQPIHVASSYPGQSSAHPMHPVDNIPVQSEQDTLSLSGTRSPTKVENSLDIMQEPVEVPIAGTQSSTQEAQQEVTRIVSRGDNIHSVNTSMTRQPDHSRLQPETITPDRRALTPGVIRPQTFTHVEVVESTQAEQYRKARYNGLEEEGSSAVSATPTIQVTIGHIEVRATPPPPSPPTQSQAQDTTPSVMSLDQYLHQRAKGDHR